jgi:hypothetical protein
MTPRIPQQAKTGFWVAIGVFAAMLVWNYVEKRIP